MLALTLARAAFAARGDRANPGDLFGELITAGLGIGVLVVGINLVTAIKNSGSSSSSSLLPGNYVAGEPTNFYNPTNEPAYVVPGGAFPLV